MDDPGLDRDAHAAALRSLARTNRWLGGDRAVERAVQSVAGGPEPSVLDIGTGAGGLLDRIAHRKNAPDGRHTMMGTREPAADRPLLIGTDLSPQALALARDWGAGAIRWLCADARALPLPDESIDVVTCTLTLHHLDPPDAVRMLREAGRVCRLGIVFSDLTRSRTAWLATWCVTRLVSRSRVFRIDGPRSVRAAYDVHEMAELARQAGLVDASIRRQFPFRMLLTWQKTRAGESRA
jgi:ubiquinone/menaquinone biosynthesis C-methylase UbiE